MGVKLQNKKDDSVHVSTMEDGDIAEIVQWTYSCCVGRIVQRWDKDLFTLGKECGKSFSGIFSTPPHKACRVRILQPGETLEVT